MEIWNPTLLKELCDALPEYAVDAFYLFWKLHPEILSLKELMYKIESFEVGLMKAHWPHILCEQEELKEMKQKFLKGLKGAKQEPTNIEAEFKTHIVMEGKSRAKDYLQCGKLIDVWEPSNFATFVTTPLDDQEKQCGFRYNFNHHSTPRTLR
eukprot:TRINITY_DN11954_c0_g1_i1.p1 TRINITY_DN11954_c0_g1~~TRINITY_DN11954_c0_g1_i1.p1  ORF type:complete len:180 (+),score=42.07 TRINITY_DN11954_c0_g1_i1:84-542(+)